MRRHATASSTPTPRRRPVWNAYLTDDAQYRLSEQQQLQRQLQQLSTAHFSSRSPSHALRAANMTPTPRRHRSTINNSNSSNNSREYAVQDDSLASIQNTTSSSVTPRNARPRSADSAGRRRKPGATVSFQLDHDDRNDEHAHKANLQSELAALEQMLEVLEAETATLHHDEALQTPVAAAHLYTSQQELHTMTRQSPVQKRELYVFGDESDEDDTAPSPNTAKHFGAPQTYSASDDDDSDDPDLTSRLQLRTSHRTSHTQSPRAPVRRTLEGNDDTEDSAKLSEACYKSLRISAQLAKKMDQLTRELAHERQLRLDQELKIDVLEQEVRSTRARCNYLDAKYESVLTQMGDMRTALLETRRTHEQQLLVATGKTRRKTKKLATTSRSPVTHGYEQQQEQETDTGQGNQHHLSNSAQY